MMTENGQALRVGREPGAGLQTRGSIILPWNLGTGKEQKGLGPCGPTAGISLSWEPHPPTPEAH